jgi:hypothetical protein
MGFTDVMGGIGHGLASLVGMGSLDDPMAKLRGQLSADIAKQNQMVATESLAAVQAINETLKDIYTFQGVARKRMQATIDLNQQLVWDSMDEENLFMSVLSVVIIIIIFFMLIQKKCC